MLSHVMMPPAAKPSPVLAEARVRRGMPPAPPRLSVIARSSDARAKRVARAKSADASLRIGGSIRPRPDAREIVAIHGIAGAQAVALEQRAHLAGPLREDRVIAHPYGRERSARALIRCIAGGAVHG